MTGIFFCLRYDSGSEYETDTRTKSLNIFEFTEEKKMERVISVILAVVLAAACGMTAFAPAGMTGTRQTT